MSQHSSVFQRYCFIALGANLVSKIGSPEQTVLYGISQIQELSAEPLLVSSLKLTEPLNCPLDSPLFVNAVVGFVPHQQETGLTLLSRLQAIENTVGRTRSGVVNEARVLDLDIISFKQEINSSQKLTLPHPRAVKRKFVLEPLRELVGNVIFPGQSQLIDDLIKSAD